MEKISVIGAILLLSGCQLFDWHCTKGGQWSSGYFTGDGRCTYFCADKDEKYCADSPQEAEALQSKDPEFQKMQQERAAENMELSRAICAKLGFKPETDAFANCLLAQMRMQFDVEVLNHQNNLRNAQQDIEAYKNMWQALQRGAQQIMNRPQSPLYNSPMKCTPDLVGGFTCR
ncbi:hypothetical protein [Methylococcus capsulatus]|uniref:hypothetical protein n=1 Tax=Methylococcus capsulatus TaxID=414 RepID=UPI001C532E30|nr:hypothetical protein [Methylococcus capsulatus]QXP87239.1 hypothetical protein KW112_12810 [Methylococcus capsulatus]UQN12235.1 hypothetical protein M3M30_14565 [Methylococcus capsulatus]